VWLDRVKKAYGDNLEITWRFFSLDQVNGKEGPDWRVWDQPEGTQGKSFLALRAGEAARRQGPELFDRFHLALLTARHGGGARIALDQAAPLVDVAERVGLDVGKFKQDLQERRLVGEIARGHSDGVEKHGVFGTPTFVFENGSGIFLKTYIPPEEDSVPFFEHFLALAVNRTFFGELKRPQPPWPKGALK
jgi:predicted DsbA family dithiol-disulfide isomerase